MAACTVICSSKVKAQSLDETRRMNQKEAHTSVGLYSLYTGKVYCYLCCGSLTFWSFPFWSSTQNWEDWNAICRKAQHSSYVLYCHFWSALGCFTARFTLHCSLMNILSNPPTAHLHKASSHTPEPEEAPTPAFLCSHKIMIHVETVDVWSHWVSLKFGAQQQMTGITIIYVKWWVVTGKLICRF